MLRRPNPAAVALPERMAPAGPVATTDVPPEFMIVWNEMVRSLLMFQGVVTPPPATQIPVRRPAYARDRVTYQYD